MIMHDDVEVIAVEVGAPQLPFVTSMSPWSAVCLNIADDHIDHFGSVEQYVNTKERIYRHTRHSAIYSVDNDVTRGMVERADVIEGCRAIGFTLGVPDVGMVGVVDDMLVDRAYLDQRRDAALELASTNDVSASGSPQHRQCAGSISACEVLRGASERGSGRTS